MVKLKIPPASIAIVCALAFVILCVTPFSQAKTKRRKPHPAPVKTVDPAPTPVYQPPPPTPEQGPSSPPDVGFRDGELTIVARNSTMADVLAAVKQKTGAAVEMPATSSERVVGRFGPGSPRDVMAQLLNGSHYDYVLLGSPADPRALKKVVLMARAIGPQAASAQESSAPMANQNLQAVPNISADEEQENVETPDTQQEAQPEAQQEEPQPEQPGQQNPTVKTPEQLLRELQQQQQQQQQNAPPQ